MSNAQHDSHRRDAEPGEQQEAVGIAARMISEPAHRQRAGESGEVADRIDHRDAGGSRRARQEAIGNVQNTGRQAKMPKRRSISSL